MTKIYVVLISLCFTLSLMAAQCSGAPAENKSASGQAEIIVTEASARASIPNGSIYLTLANNGDKDELLLSVKTGVAERAELHESKIDANDVMRMGPVAQIEIPAGGSVSLLPGGQHIMLVNLKKELAAGDKISLTLNFQNSAPQTIEVEVTDSLTTGHIHQ